MKTALILPLMLAAAAPALAASPFDGTWKGDIKSVKFDPKPDEFLLAKGVYTCKTCKPPVTVPADGRFHAVAGHDYYDAVAAKVDGPRALTVTLRRGAKIVATNMLTVSPDDRTLTYRSEGTSDTGVKTSGVSTSTRVAAAPAGAAAISGSWKPVALQSSSDSSTLQTLKVADGALTLSVPTGEGYTARFGGPPVLQKNDPGRTMIAVRQLAPNRIVEEDSRHGKLMYVYDMTVQPDGRTMTMTTTDKRDDTSTTVTLHKQ